MIPGDIFSNDKAKGVYINIYIYDMYIKTYKPSFFSDFAIWLAQMSNDASLIWQRFCREAPDLPEVPITEEDDGILQTEEVPSGDWRGAIAQKLQGSKGSHVHLIFWKCFPERWQTNKSWQMIGGWYWSFGYFCSLWH